MRFGIQRVIATARLGVARVLRGPRCETVSVADFARNHPKRWHQAHPVQQIAAAAPHRWGETTAPFPDVDAPYSPLGLIDISGGGSVVSWIGTAVAPDHRMLRETGWYDQRPNPEKIPRRRYPTKHVTGQCLSIATDYTHDNYGHFLLDSLSRLGLAQAAGFAPGTFDRIITAPLPGGIPPWLLQAAGVEQKQLLFTQMRQRITADRLFVTTFPGRPTDFPPSTARYLRSLLPADIGPRRRRLFVRRFGLRELTNEAELLEIAARYGFEAYDYRTATDSPRDFAEGRIVVGAHGATLANLAFCAPGTQFFEIVPSDHVEPYYMTIARAAGLPYHYMLGRSSVERAVRTYIPGKSPVHVDPVIFEAALRHLVEKDGETL